MDFALSPELAELRDRTRRFIADEIIPFENDPRNGPHGPSEDLRRELVERARAAGLLTPHASRRSAASASVTWQRPWCSRKPGIRGSAQRR
jgi:alkylation response protein AidB-like acyl-CoA dehydrogenase